MFFTEEIIHVNKSKSKPSYNTMQMNLAFKLVIVYYVMIIEQLYYADILGQ